MARIAIIGAGAIGSVTAALLQQTGGHQLVLCVRRPLEGLTVETPEGTVEIGAQIVTDPAQAPEVDWVLVATKAYDAKGASKWFPALRTGGAPVAILQNGVEHRERFAPFVPVEALVPVIVDCPAERTDVARVRQRGPMRLTAPEGAPGRGFVELFAGGPAVAATTGDFTSVAWRKLCHNAPGILNALLLKPTGVFQDEAVGEAALTLIRECAAVGRAEGAHLADSVAEDVLAAYRGGARDGINSLHADRLADRPMEIDARNGVIVRRGRVHGIPTPANQLAVTLLEELSGAGRG